MGSFYFQKADGEMVLLQKNISEQEAMILMQKFLDEHNFKSYYTRGWQDGNIKWYDVGSHVEFFVFVKGDNL